MINSVYFLMLDLAQLKDDSGCRFQIPVYILHSHEYLTQSALNGAVPGTNSACAAE